MCASVVTNDRKRKNTSPNTAPTPDPAKESFSPKTIARISENGQEIKIHIGSSSVSFKRASGTPPTEQELKKINDRLASVADPKKILADGTFQAIIREGSFAISRLEGSKEVSLKLSGTIDKSVYGGIPLADSLYISNATMEGPGSMIFSGKDITFENVIFKGPFGLALNNAEKVHLKHCGLPRALRHGDSEETRIQKRKNALTFAGKTEALVVEDCRGMLNQSMLTTQKISFIENSPNGVILLSPEAIIERFGGTAFKGKNAPKMREHILEQGRAKDRELSEALNNSEERRAGEKLLVKLSRTLERRRRVIEKLTEFQRTNKYRNVFGMPVERLSSKVAQFVIDNIEKRIKEAQTTFAKTSKELVEIENKRRGFLARSQGEESCRICKNAFVNPEGGVTYISDKVCKLSKREQLTPKEYTIKWLSDYFAAKSLQEKEPLLAGEIIDDLFRKIHSRGRQMEPYLNLYLTKEQKATLIDDYKKYLANRRNRNK